MAALGMLGFLAACDQSNIPTRQTAAVQAAPVASLAPGASVREIRQVTARQKAEAVTHGSDGFVVDDEALTDTGFRTHVLRDLEKGCEYIVADSSRSSSSPSVLPRRQRAGGIMTQHCMAAGSGKGYAWIGKGMDMVVSTVRDAEMGCDFIAGQNTRSEGMFMIERMYRRPDGTMAQVCDTDRALDG